MQTFVKQRATETGDLTGFKTPAIDVGGMPLLVSELIVYTIAGSTPQITATMQTSNDLATWSGLTGSDATRTSAGADRKAIRADTAPYGKYIRFEIEITGSVTEVEYSLVLNTYMSS